MSEAVQMWLFAGAFGSIASLFFWVVSLRLKMGRFTQLAEQIGADVKECVDQIRAHEEQEDKVMESLRDEMQNVNSSLIQLAVKVGENSR